MWRKIRRNSPFFTASFVAFSSSFLTSFLTIILWLFWLFFDLFKIFFKENLSWPSFRRRNGEFFYCLICGIFIEFLTSFLMSYLIIFWHYYLHILRKICLGLHFEGEMENFLDCPLCGIFIESWLEENTIMKMHVSNIVWYFWLFLPFKKCHNPRWRLPQHAIASKYIPLNKFSKTDSYKNSFTFAAM